MILHIMGILLGSVFFMIAVQISYNVISQLFSELEMLIKYRCTDWETWIGLLIGMLLAVVFGVGAAGLIYNFAVYIEPFVN